MDNKVVELLNNKIDWLKKFKENLDILNTTLDDIEADTITKRLELNNYYIRQIDDINLELDIYNITDDYNGYKKVINNLVSNIKTTMDQNKDQLNDKFSEYKATVTNKKKNLNAARAYMANSN